MGKAGIPKKLKKLENHFFWKCEKIRKSNKLKQLKKFENQKSLRKLKKLENKKVAKSEKVGWWLHACFTLSVNSMEMAWNSDHAFLWVWHCDTFLQVP